MPTLELASVKLETPDQQVLRRSWRTIEYLFSVVDLPEDGLPTSPMRGSLGMVCYDVSIEWCRNCRIEFFLIDKPCKAASKSTTVSSYFCHCIRLLYE
jgi:hypothetical protein